MPPKFDLQLQSPLELHNVELDPEELHPHSEKVLNPQHFAKNQIIEMF